MGFIQEESRWVEKLYRIQVTDPVTGGQDGIINIQPKQLADRTRFLRDALTNRHTAAGGHSIVNEDVADDAAISYGKLDLDVPLENIQNGITACTNAATALVESVRGLVGNDGYLVNGLAKIVQLSWKYSDFGFDLEFFVKGITMRDLNNVDSRGAIALDDSLDCEDTRGLVPGLRLLLSDNVHSEEVEIWKVLEQGRIRLTKDLQYTYNNPATLGYSDWDIQNGQATVQPGRIYYSHVSSVLESAPVGKLMICRDGGDGELEVQYMGGNGNTSEWVTVAPDEVTAGPDGYFYEHYLLEGGNVQLRITGKSGTTVIKHMALFPIPTQQIVSSIRTPKVVQPEPNTVAYSDKMTLQSSVFRCIYADRFVEVEYTLIDPKSNDVAATFSSTNQTPLGNIKDRLPEPGVYYARCRHRSDIGEWSAWSNSVPFTLKGLKKYFGFLGYELASGFDEDEFYNLATEPVRFGFAGTENSLGFEEAMFTMNLED